MGTQKIKITKDMEQFHCFILLEDVKEKVRRLKSYGISDDELEELLHEEEIFPQLIVTKDYKIVIGDEIQCEVVLEPLVKAIYLLFLSHPEGIVLKCLPDYRRELKDIYNLVRPQGLTDRAEKSIINATNPVQNTKKKKCARIRKAFSCVLPHRLVKYYAISGRGKKGIASTRSDMLGGPPQKTARVVSTICF